MLGRDVGVFVGIGVLVPVGPGGGVLVGTGVEAHAVGVVIVPGEVALPVYVTGKPLIRPNR